VGIPYHDPAYMGIGIYEPGKYKDAKQMAERLWSLSWNGTSQDENIKKGK
jgi:hypothetical protein